MCADISKSEAAKILGDELLDLELSRDKAEFIMQDVVEDYFRWDDPTKMGPDLVWDYQRYQAKSNIVFDYLVRMRKVLKNLDKLRGGASK